MARVTIEDCLDKIPNRFTLVHAAARRVRQYREGAESLLKNTSNEEVVKALREVAAGKVYLKDMEVDSE